MKLQSNNNLVLTLAAMSLCMSACSKMKFSPVSQETTSNSVSAVTPPVAVEPWPAPTTPDPTIPAPVPDPAPAPTPAPTPAPPIDYPPQYNKVSGDCAADSSTSVTSCMKCNVPTTQAPEPVLSVKATNLLDVMVMACQVHNKWDPATYVPPTRQQILARISSCSPGTYPQTSMTTSQKRTFAALLDPNNDAMRIKLFGEYFMQPPQSDDFETYFGMNGQEVRQVYCYGQAAPLNDLYAPQYYQSISSPWNAGMPYAYILANDYRSQLKSCMHQSDVNPWVPTPVVTKKCQFEQMSGLNGTAISQQIQTWLNAGYLVGIDLKNQNMCSSVTSATQFSTAQGDVTIGTYHCQ